MNRKVVVVVVVGVVLLSLASCCGACVLAGLVFGDAGALPSGNASGELDGRYACMMQGTTFYNGMVMPQYQPAGLAFSIDGSSYENTAGGAGGSVAYDAQVVTFSGGGYDGWRGARSSDDKGTPLIIFRKDHGDPKPGEGVRFYDIRCARQ